MLTKKEIEKLIKERNLIENYFSLDIQIQPNGFDVTTGKIFKFKESGAIDFSNSEREIPETKEIKPEKRNSSDKYGWWNLERGGYKIRTNERIRLPKDLIAISFPRSSLLRMGAFTQTAVWDAGFKGRGEFVLVVHNPDGIKIKQNARLTQLIFLKVNKTEGYQGIFHESD